MRIFLIGVLMNLGAFARADRLVCENAIMPLDLGGQTSLVKRAAKSLTFLNVAPWNGVELRLAKTADAGVANWIAYYEDLGIRHFIRAYHYTVDREDPGRITSREEQAYFARVLNLRDDTHPLNYDTLFIPGWALTSDASLKHYFDGLYELLTTTNELRLENFNEASAKLFDWMFDLFGTRATPFAHEIIRGRAHEERVIEMRTDLGLEETSVAWHEITHIFTTLKLNFAQTLANVARGLQFRAYAAGIHYPELPVIYREHFQFDEVEANLLQSSHLGRRYLVGANLKLAMTRDFFAAERRILSDAVAHVTHPPASIVSTGMRASGLEQIELPLANGWLVAVLPRAGLPAGQALDDYFLQVIRARQSRLEQLEKNIAALARTLEGR